MRQTNRLATTPSTPNPMAAHTRRPGWSPPPRPLPEPLPVPLRDQCARHNSWCVPFVQLHPREHGGEDRLESRRVCPIGGPRVHGLCYPADRRGPSAVRGAHQPLPLLPQVRRRPFVECWPQTLRVLRVRYGRIVESVTFRTARKPKPAMTCRGGSRKASLTGPSVRFKRCRRVRTAPERFRQQRSVPLRQTPWSGTPASLLVRRRRRLASLSHSRKDDGGKRPDGLDEQTEQESPPAAATPIRPTPGPENDPCGRPPSPEA